MLKARTKLLYGYRLLQVVPFDGHLLLLILGIGHAHSTLYRWLKKFARENQDALYDLVFSESPKDKELHDLIWLGSHGGSEARKDNIGWVDFIARVRARKDELPEIIQVSLDWYERVQGW